MQEERARKMKRQKQFQTKSSGNHHGNNQPSTSTPHKAIKSQARHFPARQRYFKAHSVACQAGNSSEFFAGRSRRCEKRTTAHRLDGRGRVKTVSTEVFFDGEEELQGAQQGGADRIGNN